MFMSEEIENIEDDKEDDEIKFRLGKPDLSILSNYQKRCLRKIDEKNRLFHEYTERCKKIMEKPVSKKTCVYTAGGGEAYLRACGII